MRVELVRAWPRHFERVAVELAPGARVGDAMAAAGWALGDEFVGLAVFGEAATAGTVLADGDRIELLRGLRLDPKQARRRRASRRGGRA